MHSTGCRGMQMGVISMPRVSLGWHHPVTDCGFRMNFSVEYLLWKWVRVKWRCAERIWFHTLSASPLVPFYSFHLLALRVFIETLEIESPGVVVLFSFFLSFPPNHIHASTSLLMNITRCCLTLFYRNTHCYSKPQQLKLCTFRETNSTFSRSLTSKELHFVQIWSAHTHSTQIIIPEYRPV